MVPTVQTERHEPTQERVRVMLPRSQGPAASQAPNAPHAVQLLGVPTWHTCVSFCGALGEHVPPQSPVQERERSATPDPHCDEHEPQAPQVAQEYGTLPEHARESVPCEPTTQSPPQVPEHTRVRDCVPPPHVAQAVQGAQVPQLAGVFTAHAWTLDSEEPGMQAPVHVPSQVRARDDVPFPQFKLQAPYAPQADQADGVPTEHAVVSVAVSLKVQDPAQVPAQARVRKVVPLPQGVLHAP
jgi:hypothetical protein